MDNALLVVMYSIRLLVLVVVIQLHLITKVLVVFPILNVRSVNIITDKMFALAALQIVHNAVTLLVHVLYVVLVIV